MKDLSTATTTHRPPPLRRLLSRSSPSSCQLLGARADGASAPPKRPKRSVDGAAGVAFLPCLLYRSPPRLHTSNVPCTTSSVRDYMCSSHQAPTACVLGNAARERGKRAASPKIIIRETQNPRRRIFRAAFMVFRVPGSPALEYVGGPTARYCLCPQARTAAGLGSAGSTWRWRRRPRRRFLRRLWLNRWEEGCLALHRPVRSSYHLRSLTTTYHRASASGLVQPRGVER